jgi:hypothetical protein
VFVDPKFMQQAGAKLGERRIGMPTGLGDIHLDIEADVAVGQDKYSIGQKDGLIHVMGHQKNCRLMTSTQLLQKSVHSNARQGIQRAKWFVQEQEAGVSNQGASERRSLRFASRERFRPIPSVVVESNLAEGALSTQRHVGSRQSEHDIGQYSSPGKKSSVLEHHGASLRDADGTLHLGIEAGQGSQEGALAAATVPQQRHEFSVVQAEVDPLQNAPLAKTTSDIRSNDRIGRCRHRQL